MGVLVRKVSEASCLICLFLIFLMKRSSSMLVSVSEK